MKIKPKTLIKCMNSQSYINKIGVSIDIAPPKVDLSGLGGREIRVRAGEPLKIDVPISGAPTPTVAWKKDGKDLPDTNRVQQ